MLYSNCPTVRHEVYYCPIFLQSFVVRSRLVKSENNMVYKESKPRGPKILRQFDVYHSVGKIRRTKSPEYRISGILLTSTPHLFDSFRSSSLPMIYTKFTRFTITHQLCFENVTTKVKILQLSCNCVCSSSSVAKAEYLREGI